MYAPKKEGGLGMRNLAVFNKALLAKQAWRIIKYPHSLMAKTLAHKYFPHSSFMNVKESPVASYTWKSILSARELVRRGMRKVVGSGNSVDIWVDPWVPSLPNFRVLTRRNAYDGGPVMVSELIEEGNWRNEVLHQLFSSWEISAIKSIALPRTDCRDQWAWHYSKKGEFTVRSAYYMELNRKKQELASTSAQASKGIWKRIWDAKIPTKIKQFGWRVIHNGVAVRANLGRRGLTEEVRCPMCGEEIETTIHTLFECEEVRRMWYVSPLRLVVQQGEHKSVKQWCENLARDAKDEAWWNLFWCIMWGVWLRRNKWVFDQKKISVEDVLNKAVESVWEFQAANDLSHGQTLAQTQVKKRWKPPEGRGYKVNSDAALFNDGKVGCGAIMRDEYGDVMAATSMLIEGGYAIDEAEALAARHALEIAIDAGLRNLTLESDCLNLIKSLKQGVLEVSSFGNLVGDILNLGKACCSLSFNHVGRNGNQVAHKLAHLSRNFSSMRVWIEEVPVDVMPLVEADLESHE